MALRNLSVEEMVAVSQAWLSPEGDARRVLEGVGRLMSLLPELERAHTAIFALRPPTPDPRHADMAQQAAELDMRHDRLARGIFGALSGLALLEQDPSFLALRDTLMPHGTAKAIHASLRGQAGHAALLKARMTADVRAQLAAIVWARGTLLQRVDEWLEVGARLGELEEARAQLPRPDGAARRKQTLDARNGWVRVVSALRSVAALSPLDPAHAHVLWGPLRDAEGRADARAARRKPAHA